MNTNRTVCLLTDDRIHAVTVQRHGRRVAFPARGAVEFRLPCSLGEAHDPEALAEAIAKALELAGPALRTVTLVIPLSWCFTQVLPKTGRRMSPQTLAFAFEEHLPLPLEELIYAFAPISRDAWLAVAVAGAPLRSLLDALSQREIEVDGLFVDALVVAEAHHASAPFTDTILVDSRGVRLVRLPSDDAPPVVASFGLPSGLPLAEAIRHQLQLRGMTVASDDGCWTVVDLTGVEHPIHPPAVETRNHYAGPEAIDFVAHAAASPGRSLDLLTGALRASRVRGHTVRLVDHCLAAALLLVLILGAGFSAQGRSIRRDCARVDAEKLAAYQTVYDTPRLPPAAGLRLASERLRLEALTQSTPGTSPANVAIAPLEAFRDFVGGLPADVRVMLLEARLDERQWRIRGQTAEHHDAERIVEAVNGVAGVQANPPRTNRLATGGVEFSIIATASKTHGGTKRGEP